MIQISNRLNLNAEALLQTFGLEESTLMNEQHWQDLASHTFKQADRAQESQREISLSFVSAEEIQQLNKEYRSKDAVTDVLSFEIASAMPRNDGSDVLANDGSDVIASEAKQSLPLGDIVICLERAQEQAQDLNQSLKRELSFLFVHGLLHLLGYDHIQESEAEEMYALQRRILNEFLEC